MADYNIIVKVVKRRRAEIIVFLLILEKWRKQKRLSKTSRRKSRSCLLRHNQQNNIATRLFNNSSSLLATDTQEGIIPSCSPAISTSSNPDAPQNNSTFITPGLISPALSTSTCGISDVSQGRFKKRSKHNSTEDNFSEVINSLAQLSRQPIIISNNTNDNRCSLKDPLINGFLSFTGAILQSFQDEELKLEVISTITQTVTNARSLDLQRERK
ncbi:hypothetical protein PV325_012938 [Microctonus aethiopoides]|uniref:Uncharacterized protein n=1 Tax=Microctonus aethiopoides TaxID=144406 RepID=A0AA39FMM8_9HYME|nr:hypothetical protein PV325_012938 [Microctonus aethiopoides]KAK0172440.1 hypothetical protein PV328_005756 [Microctonus aethiopoides]